MLLILLFFVAHLDSLRSEKRFFNPCKAGGYQGDVALSDQDLKYFRSRRYRRAVSNEVERKWPNGVIPYEISNDFNGNQKAVIQSAIRHWEVNTCLSFVNRKNEEEYAVFQNEGSCGCCSYVGRMGDGLGQGVNLAESCIRNGTIAHEIGHLIGFWHEHTRPDRDRYVQIHKSNVLAGELKNFRKLSRLEVNSFDVPYDFGSIMHYAKTTFSKNGYDITIRPVPGLYNKEIGQRLRLSPLDILQANRLYNCPSCGRTLTDSSGNFSFLTSKIPNLEPQTCVWRVFWTAGEGLLLRLKYVNFKFGCRRTYLEIRDGKHSKSPLIGRYCRDKPPPKALSLSKSSLWLKFHYGYRYYVPKRHPVGFIAEYTVSCGGIIEAEKGELMSPGYPGNYKANKKCQWDITVPKGGKVAVMFHMLDLENGKKCEYDHVELIDKLTGKRLSKLCGTKFPKDYILSQGNKMRVKFNTDSDVHHKGFSLSFITEIDECATGKHNCTEICQNTVGGYECHCPVGQELHSNGRDCEKACGWHYTEEDRAGKILSPSYPHNYPINRKCTWTIRAKMGYKIALKIIDFDLEESKVCNPSYDYLEIKAGSVHERLCGSLEMAKTIESDSNKMTIRFNSDNTVSGKGFKAEFMHIRDHCAHNNGGCEQICTNALEMPICSCRYGYVLAGDKKACQAGDCSKTVNSTTGIGSISSPNYPQSYRSSRGCRWKVMTLPGQIFNISFDDIKCNEFKSRLIVSWRFGKKVHSKSLCRYSGRKHNSFFSDGNVFTVDFKLGRGDFGGFKLSYKSSCGGTFLATRKTQTFFSHIKYGSQSYPPYQNCFWLIRARGRKRRVELRFKKFHLEDSPCNYDFVKIYDGYRAVRRNLLGTECGHSVQKRVYQSTGRELLVNFKSDTSVSAAGFEAVFVRIGRRSKRHHIRLYDPFKDWAFPSRTRDLYT